MVVRKVKHPAYVKDLAGPGGRGILADPGNEFQRRLDGSPCPEHQVNINQYSVENTGSTKTMREGLLADPGLRVSMTIRWEPMS